MAEKRTKTEEAVEEKKDKEPDIMSKAYWNELVPFEAFRDSGKYSKDIIVGVNGKIWQIQRGERVMIPRKVYEVLRLSQEQDNRTAKMIEQTKGYHKIEVRKYE